MMIGAALYNRTIQVEQLYIKQRNNQLTLSGEFGWPEKLADWMQPAQMHLRREMKLELRHRP